MHIWALGWHWACIAVHAAPSWNCACGTLLLRLTRRRMQSWSRWAPWSSRASSSAPRRSKGIFRALAARGPACGMHATGRVPKLMSRRFCPRLQ
eukprot:352894-Chlamydomonas_euryale.AAC.3